MAKAIAAMSKSHLNAPAALSAFAASIRLLTSGLLSMKSSTISFASFKLTPEAVRTHLIASILLPRCRATRASLGRSCFVSPMLFPGPKISPRVSLRSNIEIKQRPTEETPGRTPKRPLWAEGCYTEGDASLQNKCVFSIPPYNITETQA